MTHAAEYEPNIRTHLHRSQGTQDLLSCNNITRGIERISSRSTTIIIAVIIMAGGEKGIMHEGMKEKTIAAASV